MGAFKLFYCNDLHSSPSGRVVSARETLFEAGAISLGVAPGYRGKRPPAKQFRSNTSSSLVMRIVMRALDNTYDRR